MRSEDTIDDIRNALNGRPGQPIVFGVCRSLAARVGAEPWLVRAAAIVFGLFLTLPTLAAYIILGLCMKETEARTRGFFTGLGVMFREWCDKFCRSSRSDYDSDGYRQGGYR